MSAAVFVASEWQVSHRFDGRAVAIADRHYSRQKPGSPQFVAPGRCLVLWQPRAVWVTSWQFEETVKHDWPGAWNCAMFRNEGAGLSSELITQAVAHTRWKWGEVPPLGMVTFVKRESVRPKKNPGYCFLMAGFEFVGETKGGLLVYQLAPSKMPSPLAPKYATASLFEGGVDQQGGG